MKKQQQRTVDAKDAISEKIATTSAENPQSADTQQPVDNKKEDGVLPMPDLSSSPVQHLEDSKSMAISMGISKERIPILSDQAAEAIKRFLSKKTTMRSLLLSDACLQCQNNNETAFVSFMVGGYIDNQHLIKELLAFIKL